MSAGEPGGPSVTVLIPTFDRAEFLDASIGSLLAQDYERLEVLVLDDGSTDGTPEILERFAASDPERFRWTRHHNMGQARTLNRGFELARGEVVGYLSSDDVLLPRATGRLAAVFASEPDTVAAYPAWENVDVGGKRLDRVMPEEFSVRHAIEASDPVIGPGALVRRSVIGRVGGWDPSIRYSADFEFWLRVGREGTIRRVPEVLAQYRWHEGMEGRSNRGPEIALERLAIADAAFGAAEPSDDLEGGRLEAYRSAFLVGAGLLGPNAEWERFFLRDRLDDRIFERRRLGLAARAEELRSQVGGLQRELGNLGARMAALGDTAARQYAEDSAVDPLDPPT